MCALRHGDECDSQFQKPSDPTISRGKRYAAAYGVHPLDRPAHSPRRPPSIHSSRQTQPHPAPRRPKRKFLSKSAARQKMRASEHGWAALRSATFRAIDRTTYAIGKRGDDVPLRISPRTPRSVSKDTATRQKNEGVRSWMGGPTLSYPRLHRSGPGKPSWSWRCGSYEESNEEDMVMGVETFPILDDVVLPPAKGRAARPRKSDVDPIQKEKRVSLPKSTRFDNVSDGLRGLFSTPSLMMGEDPHVYAELYRRVEEVVQPQDVWDQMMPKT